MEWVYKCIEEERPAIETEKGNKLDSIRWEAKECGRNDVESDCELIERSEGKERKSERRSALVREERKKTRNSVTGRNDGQKKEREGMWDGMKGVSVCEGMH